LFLLLVNRVLTFELVLKKLGFLKLLYLKNPERAVISLKDIHGPAVARVEEQQFILSFKYPVENPEVHIFNSRPCGRVSSAVVNVKSGLTFTNGINVLQESSSWPITEIMKDSYDGSYLAKYIPNKINNALEDATVLSSQGFYHWLIEDLPRYLFLLENSLIPFKTLVYKNKPKYVSDFLNMFDIKYEKTSRVVFVPKLLVPGKNPETGYPNPGDLEILRRKFVRSPKNNTQRKIYVTREYSTRSPIWESELSRRLFQDGWEIVATERLTLQEQVRVFAGASQVCGVHGAGLSGVVWAEEGTRVIEIEPEFRSNCFANLSSVLNHDYHRIRSSKLSCLDIFTEVQSISSKKL